MGEAGKGQMWDVVGGTLGAGGSQRQVEIWPPLLNLGEVIWALVSVPSGTCFTVPLRVGAPNSPRTHRGPSRGAAACGLGSSLTRTTVCFWGCPK